MNKCIFKIIFWLHVVSQYAKNDSCSKVLNIYIYFTSLLKILPTEDNQIIGKLNVNTGFTMTCIPDSRIVIYRKEEWYKVFIHETLHNFGLDFSGMNNDNTREAILKIFPVSSEVKLYEAYTDSWAKILNVLVCSYLTSDKKQESYILNTNAYINLERMHCFFQAVKILNYMNLTYENLYSSDEISKNKRIMYKEETSILSYYIICSIILNNYQLFLQWCIDNNDEGCILSFDKTPAKQIQFCKFIEEYYKSDNIVKTMKCTLENLKYNKKIKNKSDDIKYLLNNMRKSLLEID